VLRFFFSGAKKLATAKYIFLNDNFMPLGQIRLRPEAVVTQLWHAEGAFKKFGLSIEQPPAVRAREKKGNERLTWVVCSSKSVAPIYAEAFGVDPSKVLALGAPRADRLLQPGAQEGTRQAIEERYPAMKGKKLVLWAPTFRDDPLDDAALLGQIDMDAFRAALGDDYLLLLRLHPQIHPAKRQLPGALDVTDEPDTAALVLACDVLVTDYSSICMTAALLQKKTVFFAFDLERYRAKRDFYFSYEDYVPGPVTRTFDETLRAIAAPFDAQRCERFVRFNFDYRDCGNAARVVEAVVRQKPQ
jgi:CDP-ribitol ribitolphosphotransferase